MKTSPVLSVLAVLGWVTATAIAQDTAESTGTTISAKEFVEKAGVGGQAEIEMSQLGVQKAKSGRVKTLAKHLVTDHTKANEELLAAIKGKGLEVPSSRDPMHKATMDSLQQEEAGKQFDRDFLEHVITDHKTHIELFETAADDPKLDAMLRGYAKKTLPTLRDHLNQAQTIESELANQAPRTGDN